VGAPHFFVDPAAAVGAGPGATVSLSPEDSRHALRSLRLRPGQAVTLADGRGWWADGRLAGGGGGVATVSVLEVRTVAREHPEVSVALGPPGADRLAWAAQKLTELGVDEILLLRTERVARWWGPGRERAPLERLLRVCREAAMQSRRAFLPALGLRGLDQALAEEPRPVVLWERATAPLRETLPTPPAPVRLVVGPEGGLSDGEAERARGAGAPLASLGPRILRTETAAVAGAALVLAGLGRLG
jgi:16S rRNA (uracil1498-N3)-methyltransferase